jgi:hypothetical protein
MPTSTNHETKTLMKITHGALLAGVMLLGACSEPTIPDYNNPSESDYAVITTGAQLESQAIGLADVDRRSHDFQILINETIARDFYRMDGAEPRYITQTLRANTPSNANFIGSAIFTGPFRTIRSSDFFIRAVDAAPTEIPATPGTAPVAFTDVQRDAAKGWAQTWKAISYMRMIEERDTVGIPIYESPTVLSPIRFKDDVLRYITAVLDSASTDLTAAGAIPLPFRVPTGMQAFDSATSWNRFVQGLKAKNEVYRAFQFFASTTAGAARDTADFSGIDQAALTRAQTALNASFINLTATQINNRVGVYHTYAAGGDYLNPNFDPTIYRVNPRVVFEADSTDPVLSGTDTVRWVTADRRVEAKVELGQNNDCLARSSVRSCFLDKTNATNITPLPVLRNDELVLLQAEIFWGQANFAGALAIVNDVRAQAGLAPRSAASFGDAAFGTSGSKRALLREILKQKRYQLLNESPTRWVDMRMFGLLAEMGDERGNPSTGVQILPIPLTERIARGGVLTKVDIP